MSAADAVARLRAHVGSSAEVTVVATTDSAAVVLVQPLGCEDVEGDVALLGDLLAARPPFAPVVESFLMICGDPTDGDEFRRLGLADLAALLE